jgi:methylthioribose-1-phosphate isomerase
MNIDGKAYRTIWLAADGWSVEIIDQTKLPHAFSIVVLKTLDDAAAGHQDHASPRRAADRCNGSLRLCLALRRDSSQEALNGAIALLGEQRPTAVNLHWALAEMRQAVRNLPPDRRVEAAYRRAGEICEEDVETNLQIGRNGRI